MEARTLATIVSQIQQLARPDSFSGMSSSRPPPFLVDAMYSHDCRLLLAITSPELCRALPLCSASRVRPRPEREQTTRRRHRECAGVLRSCRSAAVARPSHVRAPCVPRVPLPHAIVAQCQMRSCRHSDALRAVPCWASEQRAPSCTRAAR